MQLVVENKDLRTTIEEKAANLYWHQNCGLKSNTSAAGTFNRMYPKSDGCLSGSLITLVQMCCKSCAEMLKAVIGSYY